MPSTILLYHLFVDVGSRYWSTFLAALSEKGHTNPEVHPDEREDFEDSCGEF